MKIYSFLFLALTFSGVTSSFAQNSIGWNYQRAVGLAPTDTAGAPGFAQDNWNNHAGSGQGPGAVPLNDLVDALGDPSTLDVTAWSLSTNNSWQHGQTSTSDEVLNNDFNNKEPSLTFEEIPFTTNGYTLIVYYGNNEGPSTSTLTVGTQSRDITTGTTSQASVGINGYLEGTDINSGTPTNYSVFSGNTSASITVSLTGANNNGISAIQFVEELNTDPPAPPSNPDPAQLAVDVSVGKILDWDDANRADEYDVFLWLNADPEPGAPTATVSISEYDPPADLMVSTAYSWKVVSRNTASASTSDGPVWEFTTGSNLPPSTPVNPSPSIGASGVDPATTLDWDDSARASSYNVYLWIPPASKPGVPTDTSTSSEYLPSVILSTDTEYYWTVEAVNGNGTTPAAEAFWSFTTQGPPAGPPSNPFPQDTAIDVSPITALDWDDVVNATSYNVRLWLAADSRPVDPTATVSGSEYFPPSVLTASTAYSWDVEAVNALGTTSGGPWTFTTASGIPGPRKIGWNMQGVGGVPLPAGAVAGAPGFEQADWNNHSSSGQAPGSPVSDLFNDLGIATTADVVSWTQSTNNSWQHEQTATPDEILMNDFANRQVAISFGEIPFEKYDVIVYYGNNEGPSTSTLSVGSTSLDITTGTTADSSVRDVGYVEGTSENTGSATNYAIFTDLTSDPVTISFAGENNNGVSAIQLIEVNTEQFEITVFRIVSGEPEITFRTIPGATYGIERSTSMAAQTWSLINDDTVATSEQTVFTDRNLANDIPGATEVFYRAVRIE